MFFDFWNEYLYRPLFNGLIWIYNNWTNANMGWAIVQMTILLRFVLLPFTLIDERNSRKNEALLTDLESIEKAYHKDPVLQKQEMRRVVRARRIKPWAKVIVLGIQALVLVLLYQVFVRGITGEKILKVLYPTIDFPGAINTEFFGAQLGEPRNWAWAGAVGVFLLVEIYFESRKYSVRAQVADMVYLILFPLAVFAALWWLPMAKSLFILTSMIFSVIIGQFSKPLFQKQAHVKH